MSDPAPPIPTPSSNSPGFPSIKVCSNCQHSSVYHLGADMVVGKGPCMVGNVPGLTTHHPCECKEWVEPVEKQKVIELCLECGGELQFGWVNRQARWICIKCGKDWAVKMLPVHPRTGGKR